MGDEFKIRFNQDHTVSKEKGADSFKKGKVYPMSEASAFHFIRRGLAENNVDYQAREQHDADVRKYRGHDVKPVKAKKRAAPPPPPPSK